MSAHSKPDPVKDAKNIIIEVKEWEVHLNTVTGVFAFTFAIAALGTPVPQLWAAASLAFLLIFQYSASRNKLTTLRTLDNKKNRTEYEEFLRDQIRSSHIKIHRYPTFIIGLFTLFFVILAPDLTPENDHYNLIMEALYEKKPYAKIADALKPAE